MTVTSKRQLACAITTMHYGELLRMATELSEMCAPDNGARKQPKSEDDFAHLLFDWAESTIEQ